MVAAELPYVVPWGLAVELQPAVQRRDECGAEYRSGIVECADCRVPLQPERPAAPQPAVDPDLELVTVWEGYDPLLVAAAE